MMSNEENVGVLIDAWKLMVGRLPDARIEQAGGIATMFGHVPMPFFNLSAAADAAKAPDLAMINGHAYGMPLDLFECMCNLYLWHDDSFGYVGYAGGRAVATAAAF